MLIEGFRGWGHLDVRPGSHVLVAGVPRAGRTDLITALARVLDPDAARGAALSDLHQRPVIPEGTDPAAAEAGDDVAEGQAEAVVEAPAAYVVGPGDAAGDDASGDNGAAPQAPSAVLQRVEAAQVEVTLTDFDPNVQQLLDGVLEPLEDSGCASEDPDASADAPLCARLAYRLSYDEEAETLESVVYFPARSNPALGQYSRVPAATRRMLPVVTLDAGQPLQLRAGAGLRRILDERDAKAGAAAFDALAQAVAEAVSALSASPAVAEAVNAVLAVGGTGERIGDAPVTYEPFGWQGEWYVDVVSFERTEQDGLPLFTVRDQYLDVVVEGMGPTYRLIDLDEAAAALLSGELSPSVLARAMVKAQEFTDRYLHRGAVFPPPALRELFDAGHQYPDWAQQPVRLKN
ncbi:hypothetical protein [Streptomyces sp. NPDC054804]